MPVFNYRARNPRGEYTTGTMEAETASSVADQLKSNGSVPFEITVGSEDIDETPCSWHRDPRNGFEIRRSNPRTSCSFLDK